MNRESDKLLLSKMECLTRRQLQYLEDKYVSRTLKCVPEKFQEMCQMHLAFLLDLSDDKLELLLSEEEHDKKKKPLASVAVFKRKDKTPMGLFGSPLTDEGVCLMMPLLKFLKTDANVCKEGIFRKPGNCARMNTLREMLVAQGPSLDIDPQIYTPYDVAGVLKEFLRDLPEPLLTERHMEAHRQVAGLGKHATLPEEVARYTKKKLSALQLLMLLMPRPAQKMTRHVVTLLHQVAECAETKMTPATLGTIFAPIFFLNRKVDATEVCSIVAQTEPAVAFMIENAHELFQAPKELIIDLANYWNRLDKESPTDDEDALSDHYRNKKSLSSRTLNTNVCYLDRERSRCDDIAGNTQAELESLFAHVQSLPDTPHNIRLKKQILKATTTPTSSTKKHKRSKSISASIKKRFPSMGRSKNKNAEISRLSTSSASSSTSASSYDEVKSLTPAMTDLLTSPTTPKLNFRISRPQHKRSSTQTDAPGCSPPKQECRNSPLLNITEDKENVPAAAALKKSNSTASLRESFGTPKHTPSNTASPVRYMGQKLGPLPLSLAKQLSPSYLVHQSENEITYVPNYRSPYKKRTPTTPSKHFQKHMSRVEFRSCKTPGTPVMPRAFLQMAQANNTLETSI
ncbi:rho GTPase-activating protein 19-like [Physella acuta]|uniref:rho GTPase-activating protein 19-like n=1 Tax=Physella acuta TaxID=109671 RepID=UPI0027DE2D5E|nr:rho GTPase-activating protein 19-like [Physella acuta]